MESLGQFLKRERESRGISQEDLARVIRYHLSKIEALESDRYELLPAPPYVKGMLRSIAKYLGLEVHEVISRYEEVLKAQTVEEVPRKVKIPTLPFYQQKNFLIISATLSFVVLIILVSLFFKESKKVKSIEEIASIPQTKTQDTSVVSPPSSEEKGKHVVLLKPSFGIWIKVQIDSEPPQQFNIKIGESVELSGKKAIRFFVSDAKGLEISFNGKGVSHSFEGSHTFVFPPALEASEQK